MFFSIDIPFRMQRMTELNEDAILQFGYVEEVESADKPTVIYEHFLIVLMETKAEIAGYSVELHPEIVSYQQHALELLQDDREDFKILTSDESAQEINNVVMMRSEATCPAIESEDEGHYFLTVYEGEKAFYQVLTWCPESQVETFREEIERLIHSFKEL